MEEHLPSYSGEPGVRVSTHYGPNMASLAEPMVEVHDGRTSSSRGKESCLEKLLECFAKAGLIRIRQSSRDDKEESARRPANSYQLVQEYDGYEVDTGVLANEEVQNTSELEQEIDGSPRTHGGDLCEGRTNGGPPKRDGMELDYSRESNASP